MKRRRRREGEADAWTGTQSRQLRDAAMQRSTS
jgi:hypothetical protein